ncbi:Uncharacterised protein [Streptococcus pneumoniae]|nr:Uncharacterised protein [Streptococcus pneumoniae]VMN97762.1 Uncharacterised protein [Streptococcus pneumoniae]
MKIFKISTGDIGSYNEVSLIIDFKDIPSPILNDFLLMIGAYSDFIQIVSHSRNQFVWCT